MQLKIHQNEIDAISDLKRVSLTSSSHFFVSAFSMFLIKERKLSRSRLNSALVYTLVAITYNGGKVMIGENLNFNLKAYSYNGISLSPSEWPSQRGPSTRSSCWPGCRTHPWWTSSSRSRKTCLQLDKGTKIKIIQKFTCNKFPESRVICRILAKYS